MDHHYAAGFSVDLLRSEINITQRRSTNNSLNKEPRMDADQHGLNQKEETRHSRFSVAESPIISVSIRVHPWFHLLVAAQNRAKNFASLR